MKKLFLLSITVIFFFSNSYSQNVGINADGTSPDKSAMLDVKSADKGLLIPRVSLTGTDDATTIPTPTVSLLVYNTATTTGNAAVTPGYYYWGGDVWQRFIVATDGHQTHYIGEKYGGGIVFYVYDNGQHGLIAATADQSTQVRWLASDGTYTNTRARANGVGAGLKNTAIIIANQLAGGVDGGISKTDPFAATVCNEYSVTVDGVTYGDWYLPSKYELNLLFLQQSVVGNFSKDFYWSSTESDFSLAWCMSFDVNIKLMTPFGKGSNSSVRAIRSF